jgi:hypothetical protein
LRSKRLIVAIGVIRDPTLMVQAYYKESSAQEILRILLPQPLSTAIDAQKLAQQVKGIVSSAAARLGAESIDLFYVGPASFAVVLGHRWNAMLPTQVHEFDPAAQAYFPSVSA